jgi:two-component system, sporulation sensor kinase E
MFDTYTYKTQYKIIILVIALFIAGFSLYYTDHLVRQLASREKKMIQIYANALETMANASIDDDQTFLVQEIITANTSVPVILVKNDKIIDHKNISALLNEKKTGNQKQDSINQNNILKSELVIMKSQYRPIEVKFGKKITDTNHVYYRDSDILYQLRYYPYLQIVVLTLFGGMAYLAFSSARRAEQNRVWVGLAKETAHQLGTPISSLGAWLEYLKDEPALKQGDIWLELKKDIVRLETVTARFSNIGSEPTLQYEDIYFIILGITNYLKKRISDKVTWEVKSHLPRVTNLLMNRHLIEWVIENICKNATDAMSARGHLSIFLRELPEGDVLIEIKDTGKGMTKKVSKQIFTAGFTTKKRGWGLGLTLAKRIVENYHKGKIFVHHSEINEGTTFHIILRGNLENYVAQKIKINEE